MKRSQTVIENPFLLVATPYLQDPGMEKAVVLVVEHSPAGTLGVFINRPSFMSGKELLMMDDFGGKQNISGVDGLIWQGGVNMIGNPFVIFSQDIKRGKRSKRLEKKLCCSFQLEDIPVIKDRALMKNLSFFKNTNGMKETKETKDSSVIYPYRLTIGATLWNKGELDFQIKQGLWIQRPVDFDLIFNTPWPQVWEKSIKEISEDPLDIVVSPQFYPI